MKKFLQVKGKIRRYLLVRFKRDYVQDQMGLRQGECNQCGNCCEILFKCPFLIRQEDGAGICSIYDDRPGQCAAFPIDDACLEEVDFDCTYEFGKPGDPFIVIEEADATGESSVNGKTDAIGESNVIDEPQQIGQTLGESSQEPSESTGRLKQTRPIPVLLFNHVLNRFR